MRSLFLLLIGSILLASCASINSVSLTPIPANRKTQVRTEKSKIILLGFNFDNDFVDEAVSDLTRQCPNGQVTGLLTKDENINYFLYFVWKKQITATGFCVPVAASTTSTKTKSRKAASNEGTHNSISESEL